MQRLKKLNENQLKQILEISGDITIEDLKKHFKKLVLKYHPDRNNRPDKTEHFIKIKNAYEEMIKLLQTPKPQSNRIVINFGNYGSGIYGSDVTGTTQSYRTWNFTFG